ncbi:hypothetical protein P7K49_017831 [Saguinus oedipus]|uniref:Major facilitator superfamily (MFS) profile domain-containing protein n=2 Tax=Cebidae TaxID=9498 RepID=A0ABQ9V4A8_SAGOE|nr:hypothetical protein P7K49_017831 [Saguinus oedipus]
MVESCFTPLNFNHCFKNRDYKGLPMLSTNAMTWKTEESLASAWTSYYPSAFFPFYRNGPQTQERDYRVPFHSLPWALALLPLCDEESGPKVLLTWEGEESLEEGEGKAAQGSQRPRRRPRQQSCRAESLRALCVRAAGAQLGQRTAHPFGAGRQGPCGQQAGSPGGHRDPRAQWRGRQQNRQHCRDHPHLQRSKCPRPRWRRHPLPAPPPPLSAWHFPPAHLVPPTACLALAPTRPLPLLCGFLRFTLLLPPPAPQQQVGTLGDAVPTEQLQGEREREREGEGDAGGDGLGSSLSLAVPPGPLSFEALLAQVGALGGGQQLQLGLCCLPVLFVALGMASDPIFTLAPPLHCHYGVFPPNASGWEQPPNASGVSVASAALAASAASRVATSTDPSCSGFAPPDFNHCLKDWDYNGLPVLTTNAIGQWDLVCDLGWQVILEQILFILGFASGYLFLGYPADRFGRRGIVLLTLGLVGPCGVGGAAAGSSTGVMALRFLLGFLLAGVDLGVYLMRLELCDPTQRLRVALAGELVGVGGHFLFLGLALVSKDWRFLQRMITAPCILFLFYGWPGLFLESARWLIVKRQIEEAQSVLRILAERNRPHGQMLGEEAQEALQDLENTCPLPATSSFSFASLLNYRNIWKNLLILGFTNFIAHAIRHCYQPVGGGGSPSDFYLCSLLASGTAALACVFLGVTVDRFGRRGILLLSMTLTGIASLVLLGLWDYLNEAAVTTFSVLGLFSSQAAAILSTLLAAEVIPTTVRGRGLGLIMALGALGGLSGPAQRLHMGHGAFLQHVVLAACALLCILSIMLLPETKRKLLPEVLRDGELCRRPSLLRQPPPNRCDHVPLLATPNPAL